MPQQTLPMPSGDAMAPSSEEIVHVPKTSLRTQPNAESQYSEELPVPEPQPNLPCTQPHPNIARRSRSPMTDSEDDDVPRGRRNRKCRPVRFSDYVTEWR